MNRPQIIFEDNHLIIVNKKAGEIVQGDKTGDQPLCEKLKAWLKDKYNKPGKVFVGVIHRLDRPVSGIVVFAKTSKALARMNILFKDTRVEKTYWAVTGNKPAETAGRLEGWLRKNESLNKSFVDPDGSRGGKYALLDYKLIASSDHYCLVEVKPVTGRHHQIRVLLAHAGMPIKGDLKYGAARSNKDGSIHLHSREITFNHPVKNQPLHIVCPPPNEPLWNYFIEQITINEK
ncbi:MAG: RNA pseudouridine synthase [Bacteroidia bacterium]|nr:RNA pseudouridine synthase [Bacteroidia bacterium]MCZ2276994.1 RNA pseudouridine synthase [Bacteroidia bacterium]